MSYSYVDYMIVLHLVEPSPTQNAVVRLSSHATDLDVDHKKCGQLASLTQQAQAINGSLQWLKYSVTCDFIWCYCDT